MWIPEYMREITRENFYELMVLHPQLSIFQYKEWQNLSLWEPPKTFVILRKTYNAKSVQLTSYFTKSNNDLL